MGWLFWAGIGLWAWTSAWARSRGCVAIRQTDRGQQEHTGVWRGVSEQHLSLHHTPRGQVQTAGVQVKGRDSRSRCEKLKVKVGGAVCPGQGGETATQPSAHRHPSPRPHGLPPPSCSLPSQLTAWVPPLRTQVRLPFYHPSPQEPHLSFILQALQGLSLPQGKPPGRPASR